MLTLTSEPSLTLAFGEEAELAVRYTEQDGTPIAGATIGLALVGRAHDSTLDELEAITDSDGIATGRVIAGTVTSAFRVRFTAPRAVAAHVDVSVGDAGFGGLRVSVDYAGERRITERSIDVYARGSCGDTRTTTGPGDRSLTLSGDATEARFFALPVLPAGESYAVVGRGRGPSRELLAWGCTDNVVLDADTEARAAVSMHDLELIVDGSYSVEADLVAATSIASLTAAARTASETTLGTAGGDAAFLLDALEASLRDLGYTAEADDLAMQRISADLDEALAMRLTAAGVGPSVAAAALADTIDARAEQILVTGSLDVVDAVPAWTMNAIVAESTGPTPSRLPLDLLALGVTPDVAMSATWLLAEDAMQLDELRVTLPLGSVGVAIAAALADEARLDGTASLMLPAAGCTELETWATEQAVIASVCDSACLLTACKTGIESLAAEMEAAMSALDTERAVVTVMGRVSLSDTEGDLRVDSMYGATLVGEWTREDGSPGDAVSGMLNGARVIE